MNELESLQSPYDNCDTHALMSGMDCIRRDVDLLRRQACGELEREVAEKTMKIQELESQVSRLSGQIQESHSQREAELEAKNEAHRELESQVSRLSGQIQELHAQRDIELHAEEQAKLELHREVSRLTGEIREAEAEKRADKVRAESQANTCATLLAEQEKMQATIDEMVRRCTDTTLSHYSVDAMLRSLKIIQRNKMVLPSEEYLLELCMQGVSERKETIHKLKSIISRVGDNIPLTMESINCVCDVDTDATREVITRTIRDFSQAIRQLKNNASLSPGLRQD